MSYGPLMIDIAGTELTEFERERLGHPLIGGVILFSRNYVSRDQLQSLCAEIHGLRRPSLLIAVDHEKKPQTDGLDALMRAMVQLPTYLERVMSGGRDLAQRRVTLRRKSTVIG